MSSTNPVGIDRLAQLSALHLYGMATAWSELLAEGPRRPVQPEAWLDRLIDAVSSSKNSFIIHQRRCAMGKKF